MKPESQSTLRSVLQDPLIHFLLLGGLLFWWRGAPQKPETAPVPLVTDQDEIVVTALRATQLCEVRKGIAGRELTAKERAMVIEDYVQEELLVREAYRLELELDDARIRQRLADKMRFLYVGPIPDPGAEDLRAYYEMNFEKYILPASIDIEHVLVSRDPEVSQLDIDQISQQLNEGAIAEDVGVPNWLGPILRRLSDGDLTQLFGAQAAKEIWKLPSDKWEGPIRSHQGIHFFKVVGRTEETLPEFENIVPTLAADWRHDRRQRVLNQRIAELKKNYRIRIETESPGVNP